MKFLFIFIELFLFVFIIQAQEYKNYTDCIIMAEQSQNRIAIANVKTGKIIWDWKPNDSNIDTCHYNWFVNPSDAKVIYGGNYILMSASGGACALIRIKDKKTMFYARGARNPHSVEILPDGNIVCASSTGNRLTVFKTDTITFPGNVIQHSLYLNEAHNVVWDKKRNLLWTGDKDKIFSLKYNFNCNNPVLTKVDSLTFNDLWGHDLFPVPDQDALYFSSHDKMWIYNIPHNELKEIKSKYKTVKSISLKPGEKSPVIIVPKEQWWTDEIIDLDGNSIFSSPGLKIYKARWIVNNTFSYQKENRFKVCK